MDINMASGVITDHRHSNAPQGQHEPLTSAQPLAAAWTTKTSTSPARSTGTNMASGGSTDHGGFLRRPSLENELFFILNILPLLRARVIVVLGSKLGGRDYDSSSLLDNTQLYHRIWEKLRPLHTFPLATLPLHWVWFSGLQGWSFPVTTHFFVHYWGYPPTWLP